MELEKSIVNNKEKKQVGQTPMSTNTDVIIDGGLNRSSEEVPVMGMEQRVGVIQLELPFTTSVKERRINRNSTKGIPITKHMVWEAYKKVKRKKGSGGVDMISLQDYEKFLQDNLYKLWNRLASGSYFPKSVREKEIPKKDGKKRKLGIPTISDRIAQQVVKDYIEPRFERIFHTSSFGYRPRRNAHQAIEQVRQNVRKFNWVIDMDIKGFFDEVSHDLLMKAVDKLVPESWVKLYIVRWLESPILKESGELVYRSGKGTPQGGVISPLLANLFLHYVFDKWMELRHSELKFTRYADDIIVHCRTKSEAIKVLSSITTSMNSCQLQLHEVKTKIVFCKKSNRRAAHDVIKFDFLGYCFKPRSTATKSGKMFLSFDCAISKASRKKIAEKIRSTKFHRWPERSIEEVAAHFNPKIQGWLNYYGKLRIRNLNRVCKIFNNRLTNWAKNRFKKFNKSYIKASKWLREYKLKVPELFVHWKYGFINS